jgi:transcriptional regulator with XRE-family HTH domain
MTIESNDYRVGIGQNLKRIRQLRGFTQEALAARIGCTYQQVQKYENGQNRIAAEVIAQIALLLEVNVSEFYCGLLCANRAVAKPVIMPSARGLVVARAFDAIRCEKIRSKLFALIRHLSSVQ